MNDKPEIEVGKLPVITKFIYTLGVLPTSYLMSMTYQEQVTWLYNYLQSEVIPLLNTESAAIQELQNLYELLRTYVNDYFDNLDVQEEINTKIDNLVSDGTIPRIIENYVNPYIEEQNSRIDLINNKVNSVASGSPTPVDNISDMTDTTKTYVLTTDGYWYYYDGDSWERGGIYQATGISETDPVIEEINSKLNPLYNKEYAKKSIQNVIYPSRVGRLSNSGSLTSSQTYGYTSKLFYAKKGSNWHIEDGATYRIRTGRYQENTTITAANCIECDQAGQTEFTANYDGWYAVSVFYFDTTQTATETIMQQLIGDIYNDITAYVNDNDSLNNAISNPTIENIYVMQDIEVSQQLNTKGNKNIEGNGYTITGNSTLTYLLRCTDGNVFINNLKLNGANNDVIYVGNNCNCIIKNCEVYYSYQNDGIGLHGNANCYIYDTIIHDNRDEGLSTHDTSYCECYNVEAYKNGYEVGTDIPSGISFGGLHFGGSRMGKAIGCHCHNNTPNGIGFVTIDGNFSSNAKSVCRNNVCNENTDTGIRFGGCYNLICGENISVNNNRGILFYEKDTHGNTGYVAKNHCFGNTTGQQVVWSGGNDGLTFEE